MENRFMSDWLKDIADRATAHKLDYVVSVDPYSNDEPVTLSSFLVSRVDEMEMFAPVGYYKNRKKVADIWNSLEDILRIRDRVKIYQNGNRWSVALYGEKLCRPILFGTGGNMNEGRYFYDLFMNPEKYSLKKFNNAWEEHKELGIFIPARGIQVNRNLKFNDYGEPSA
jgi:hypothetical protein